MLHKNLAIIFLSGVLTVSVFPTAFAQSDQGEKMHKAAATDRDHVKKAQQALKDQGMYNGAVDGIMNSQFRQALRAYQTQNQLQATGKLDNPTMSKLGIAKGKGTTGGTPKSNTTNKTKQGRFESRDEVRQVQMSLQQKGFDPGKIDGVLGPQTRKAIANFQRQQNLYASGKLDPPTTRALGVSGTEGTMGVSGEQPGREKPDNVAPNPDLNQTPEQPEQRLDQYERQPDRDQPNPEQVQPDQEDQSNSNPNMSADMASSAEDIRQGQTELKNRGFDPGNVNGMVNSDTQKALREFQAANNLPVTGSFDARTQAALGMNMQGATTPNTVTDQSIDNKPAETERAKPSPHPKAKGQDKYNKDKNSTGKMENELHERSVKAAEVLQTLTSAGENRIPDTMLERAEGIAVIPNVIKGALGIGGRYGKGLVARRMDNGRWGAPVYISIGGGSFGAQLGVNSTDLVLIFTDKQGLDSLEKGMSLKLGVDAGVTAGPIGREAEAGVTHNLSSTIYGYSHSKGLFAGVALDGAVLDVDHSANERAYGKNVNPKMIMPDAAMTKNVNTQPFVEALDHLAAKRTTER
jgi:lipid-binding SYLF domain-containing protein/peptidoglycan hydrolase-like protein with peptidoglycan-binding domain